MGLSKENPTKTKGIMDQALQMDWQKNLKSEEKNRLQKFWQLIKMDFYTKMAEKNGSQQVGQWMYRVLALSLWTISFSSENWSWGSYYESMKDVRLQLVRQPPKVRNDPLAEPRLRLLPLSPIHIKLCVLQKQTIRWHHHNSSMCHCDSVTAFYFSDFFSLIIIFIPPSTTTPCADSILLWCGCCNIVAHALSSFFLYIFFSFLFYQELTSMVAYSFVWTLPHSWRRVSQLESVVCAQRCAF